MSFFHRINDLSQYKKTPELQGEALDMEKGDVLAMAIAAFRVFLPIILVLGVITLGVMLFFRAI